MTKRGFTLVEVVSSFIIVGLALVGVMRLFSMGSKTNPIKTDSLIVRNLVQSKIEEIRCKNYSDVVAEAAAACPGYPLYTCQVDVELYDNPPLDLKKVDVIVSWTLMSGGTHQEKITTLVADY